MCILVVFINRFVVAPYCVSAVDIVIAKCCRLGICSLGHDTLFKIFVVRKEGRERNMKAKWGSSQNLSVREAEEKAGDVAPFVVTKLLFNHLQAKEISTHWRL